MTVLAASDEGGLLHAPDLYMEKLIVGAAAKHAVDLDAPVADNLARDRAQPRIAASTISSSWCSIGRATRRSLPTSGRRARASG